MARKKKTGSKLLILAGVGVGAYAAYKGGLFGAVSNWIKGAGGGGGTPNNGTDPTETPDPNGGDAIGLAAALAAIIDGLTKTRDSDNEGADGIVNDPTDPAVAPPSGSVSLPDELIDTVSGGGIKLPGWIPGVPAAGATIATSQIPGALAKLIAPIVIGTSPAVAELVHDINVAIPGDNTGLEKGNVTLISPSGPFVFCSANGLCYNLAGKKITCPDTIIGVEKHTLEWYQETKA